MMKQAKEIFELVEAIEEKGYIVNMYYMGHVGSIDLMVHAPGAVFSENGDRKKLLDIGGYVTGSLAKDRPFPIDELKAFAEEVE